MQLFYLENPTDEIKLITEENKHIIRVLRKKQGDILKFTDGKGSCFTYEIIIADSKKSILRIVNREQKAKQHNYQLHIAIAPTKNIDRFEWFLEKATEIGIDEITPIICERSERKLIKNDRGKRILISAMKQSLKYYLPQLNEATNFKNFIKKKSNKTKYIAHCEENDNKLILEYKSENTLILIGPEGDFSSEEIKLATQNKFKAVSLGSSRFRTETAGIIAAHTINLNHIKCLKL